MSGYARRLDDRHLRGVDERNDTPYTSLQKVLLDWTDIATLHAEVAEPRLQLPAQSFDEIKGDGRQHSAIQVVRHLADGPPAPLLAG